VGEQGPFPAQRHGPRDLLVVAAGAGHADIVVAAQIDLVVRILLGFLVDLELLGGQIGIFLLVDLDLLLGSVDTAAAAST
jgi:hypothetical protein